MKKVREIIISQYPPKDLECIWMMPKEGNEYDRYIYTAEGWKLFSTASGSEIDTSNFATKTDIANINSELDTKANKSDIPKVPKVVSAFTNDAGYITSAAIPTKVSAFTNDAKYITAADLPPAQEIPDVPENVSQLNNDAGYITEDDLPTKTSELVNDSGFITASDIPAPGAGKVTIQRNKTAVGSFTMNQDTNTTVNITVPTKTSDITNDSGFITASDIPAMSEVPQNLSELNNDTGFITMADVPPVPTNVSSLTNDAGYITASDLPVIPSNVSSFVNDAGYITSADIPPIPDTTSDLLNDSGFITLTDLPYIPTSTSDLINNSGFITSADLPEPVTVPENVSAFTNDAGYITEHQSLEDYYNKEEVNNLVAPKLSFQIVDALPTNGSDTVIYLVPNGSVYDEYAYVDGAWEMIGSTETDYSNFIEKGDITLNYTSVNRTEQQNVTGFTYGTVDHYLLEKTSTQGERIYSVDSITRKSICTKPVDELVDLIGNNSLFSNNKPVPTLGFMKYYVNEKINENLYDVIYSDFVYSDRGYDNVPILPFIAMEDGTTVEMRIDYFNHDYVLVTSSHVVANYNNRGMEVSATGRPVYRYALSGQYGARLAPYDGSSATLQDLDGNPLPENWKNDSVLCMPVPIRIAPHESYSLNEGIMIVGIKILNSETYHLWGERPKLLAQNTYSIQGRALVPSKGCEFTDFFYKAVNEFNDNSYTGRNTSFYKGVAAISDECAFGTGTYDLQGHLAAKNMIVVALEDFKGMNTDKPIHFVVGTYFNLTPRQYNTTYVFVFDVAVPGITFKKTAFTEGEPSNNLLDINTPLYPGDVLYIHLSPSKFGYPEENSYSGITGYEIVRAPYHAGLITPDNFTTRVDLNGSIKMCHKHPYFGRPTGTGPISIYSHITYPGTFYIVSDFGVTVVSEETHPELADVLNYYYTAVNPQGLGSVLMNNPASAKDVLRIAGFNPAAVIDKYPGTVVSSFKDGEFDTTDPEASTGVRQDSAFTMAHFCNEAMGTGAPVYFKVSNIDYNADTIDYLT